MKIRTFPTIIVLLMICRAASAQGYHIRVTYNTNLRAANSLTSLVLESAPAGSILQVLGQQGRWLMIDRSGRQVWMAGWVSHSRVNGGAPAQTPIDNCCFVDRQCNTDKEWTDGYWAFQNGHCPAPPQPQYQTGSQTRTWNTAQSQTWTPTNRHGELPHDINNCCHLDRSCHTDAEWRAGYVAFKALECWDEYHTWARTPDPGAVPAAGSDNCCTAPGWICLNEQHYARGYDAFQTYNHCNARIRPTYLPSTQYYDATDNCCRLGRQCQSEADWQRGHSDFLHFKCEFSVPLIHSVPIPLTGSQTFKHNMRTVFSLLRAKSPYYYNYVVRGLDRIVQRSQRSPEAHLGRHGALDSVICGAERTYTSGLTDDIPGNYWRTTVQSISRMVHEACHCHEIAAGSHQQLEGRMVLGRLAATEVPCLEQQHLVLRQVDQSDSTGGGLSYASKMVAYYEDSPWLAPYLEKPLSYYQHYLAVGP